MADWLEATASRRFGAFLSPTAQISDDIRLTHDLLGVFIGPGVRIGRGVEIMHHVTIGAGVTHPPPFPAPVIGHNVFIGANATLIGRVTIGDGARIGAGVTLVDAEIPAGAIIVNNAAYDVLARTPVYPSYKTSKTSR